MFATADASDAAQSVADSLNPSSITGWDLVAALIVIVASIPIARLVAAAARRALRRVGISDDATAIDTGVAAKWLVYLLALAIAASILGVNIGFLSVLFAFALVIGGLALKPMIENSASGVLLIARPAFSVGDQIQTTEFRGIVEEIGSRSTRIRQSDGVVVYVSNNQVLGNPIVVYSAEDSRKGTFDIHVPAYTDLDHVTAILVKAVASVDEVVSDPEPAVQASGLTDDRITLDVSYWYPSTDQTASGVTDRVIRSAMAALNEAGITLAVPEAKIAETSISEPETHESEPSGLHGNDEHAGDDKV